MGVKDLKNRKVVNISLRLDLIEKLDVLAEKTGLPKTRLCDRALELLFEKCEKGENLFA